MAVRRDDVQVKLDIEGAGARTELDNLQRKSKLLADSLKECVRGTKEYADTQKELRQVNKAMEEVRGQLGLTGMSYQQLDKVSKGLNRELRSLAPGTQEFIDKSKQLREVDARLEAVRREIKGIDDELKPAGNGFLDLLKKGAAVGGIALGVEAVVQGVIGMGSAIFETTKKYEKFESILTTALGSKGAAQEGMRQIQEVASKTPFAVDELTESYIKFVNRGIVPSAAELTKLSDIAASQGKSFDQLTEAVLDAGTGEFERLKEFGVQASKSGDQVELSFKGVQSTVANTPQAINAAILAFGEMEGIMGVTAAMSETLEGQQSNLGDQMDQLKNEVGQGLMPVFRLLLQVAGQFLGFLRDSKGPLSEFINYFISLYNESTAVRVIFQALVVGFQNGFALVKGTLGFLIDDFIAAGKVIKGVFTLDFNLVKQGINDAGKALKDRVLQVGTEIGQNLKDGVGRVLDSKSKIELLGVSETDADAAAESYRKAAEKVGAAAKTKEAAEKAKKDNLENLENLRAYLIERLSVVQEGSARELALKKRLAETEANIDLADEKKTAADKRIIRAELVADLRKLDTDYVDKRRKEAEKAAKDQADVEASISNLRAAAIPGELERKLAQLRAAGEKEKAAVKGTAEQIATQRLLIEQRVQRDITALQQAEDAKRAKQAKEILEKELEQERNARTQMAQNAVDIATNSGDAKRILAAKLAQLDEERNQQLLSDKLSFEERMAIYQQFELQKAGLRTEYQEKERNTNRETATTGLEQSSTALSTLQDFRDINTNKELSRVEKEKQRRLKALDEEFKQGRVSKEVYEAQKSGIEANYDQKTRNIKRQAARDEKEYNIAQAIIQGTLAVIKAAPNVPLQIAAGLTAAAGVAKIIATPIPEFEKGGVFGKAWRGVKQFATGGRFGTRGGVPDRGQLHSGGGIKMVDGASGEVLGEMERGEPYMILSRQTYANNGHIIDALLDTSMNRGGAPLRNDYFEDGGTFQGSVPGGRRSGAADAGEGAIVYTLQQLRGDVQSLKGQMRVLIGDEEIRKMGDVLDDQAAVASDMSA